MIFDFINLQNTKNGLFKVIKVLNINFTKNLQKSEKIYKSYDVSPSTKDSNLNWKRHIMNNKSQIDHKIKEQYLLIVNYKINCSTRCL